MLPKYLMLMNVRLLDRLECQRDALAAADAQRDHAALETIAMHRMDEPRREHSAGRADRMAVRHGAAFDIDDVLRQAKLLRHRQRHRREGFVDLDAFDVGKLPAGAFQRLAHGRHRAEPEQAGLDGRNAISHEPGRGFDRRVSAKARLATTIAAAPLLRPGALPAVIVPVSRKAGRSLVSTSTVVSGRGASSVAKASMPFLPLMSTLTISSANLPAFCAAPKRCCERAAKLSCASRVSCAFITRSSVCQPECLPENASSRPSRSMLS